MSENLGAAEFSINTVDRGFRSGLSEAKKLADMFVASVDGKVRLATGAVSMFVDGLGKIGLAAQGVQTLANSFQALGKTLLAGNANLEMTTTSFTTMLGSAQAADQMIRDLTKFAASTPFELTGLEASTKQLLAFGFQAKDVIPMMTAIGNASAGLGLGQAGIDRITLALGQVMAKGKIQGDELLQLTSAGIPALKMLAEAYGVTTAQMQEMVSKGIVPADKAIPILLARMNKQFGGLMDAQSKTFNGLLSNLSDWASQTTLILTKPFFEPAKKSLQAFLDFVNSPRGIALVDNAAKLIQRGVDLATGAVIRSLPHIKEWYTSLFNTYQLTMTRLTPGVHGLGAQIETLWKKWQPTIKAAWDFYKAVSPLNIAIDALKGYLTGGLPGALGALKDHFNKVADYAKQGFDFALVEVKKFGPAVLSWVADTAINLAGKALLLGEALISWVAPYAVRLVDALIQFGGKALNWAVSYAPVLANQALVWGEAIAGWVIPAIPKVLTALVQFGLGVLSWAEREIPILLGTMLRWTDAISGWVLPAIPGLVQALEQMAGTVVNWAVTRLPVLMGQVAIGVGKGLGVSLERPVGDVLLVFNSLVGTIRTTVMPAFDEMTGIMSSKALPIFDRLASFIASTVVPTLGALTAFLMTTGLNAFLTLAGLIGNIFGPSLTLIGQIIRDDLLPWLTDTFDLFDNQYGPTVQGLAQSFGVELAGGIQSMVDRFKDSLPAIEGFLKKIEPVAAKVWEIYSAFSPLAIAIDVFKGFLAGGVEGAADAFKGHMDKIGSIFAEFAPKIMDGLTTAMPKVLDWITEQAPKILDQLGEWAGKFGEFAKKAIPILLEKLGDLVKSVTKWLGDHSEEILNTLGEWTGKFIEWGAQLFTKLWPELQKLAVKLWDWIGEKAPELADKVGEWAGALLGWVVTKLIPGYIELFPKIWGAVFKFMGEMTINIGKEVLKWAGAFLGWIPDVVSQIPGKLWDIVTGIGGWFANAAGTLFQVAGNIGGKILEGIIGAIHDAPGKIWDAVTGVLGGGAIDIIKGVVKAVANFFVDVVNTPINLINSVINTLRDIDFPLVGRILGWLSPIPKLGYLSFAQGTPPGGAPGGWAMVGDNPFGPELLSTQLGNYLATNPTLVKLAKGDVVRPLVDQSTMRAINNRSHYLPMPSMVTTNNNQQTHEGDVHVHVSAMQAAPTLQQDIAIARAMRRR